MSGIPRQRLTAQLGDHTYDGEWWMEGNTVHVACVAGTRSRRLALLGKPAPLAERLLIDMLAEVGPPRPQAEYHQLG